MKLQDLVNYIADDFQKSIEEDGFDNFLSMKRSYWWTSKDIQNEVDYMIDKELQLNTDNRYNYNCFDNYEDNRNMTYSKLIRKVYKELDRRGLYKYENEDWNKPYGGYSY